MDLMSLMGFIGSLIIAISAIPVLTGIVEGATGTATTQKQKNELLYFKSSVRKVCQGEDTIEHKLSIAKDTTMSIEENNATLEMPESGNISVELACKAERNLALERGEIIIEESGQRFNITNPN